MKTTHVGERPCRYRACTDLLPPHHGPGRPVRYHHDARWPDGKTCQQMAAADRKAAREAGVGALVDSLDIRTETLLDALTPFADDLDAVMQAVTDVGEGLRAQVSEAEQARVTAQQQQTTAEERAEQMLEQVHTAQADAAAATRRAAAAATDAKEKVTAADRRVREAVDRVARLEREHGAAVRQAELADQRAGEEVLRREDAEQLVAQLRNDLDQQRSELDQARDTGETLRDRLLDSAHALSQMTQRALASEAQVRELQEAAKHDARLLQAAVDETQRLNAHNDTLTAKRLEALHTASQAHDRAAAADARAEKLQVTLDDTQSELRSSRQQVGAAERRYDTLVAALAASDQVMRRIGSR